LSVCEGGAAVPWGCLYRPGRGGEAAPGGHGHQWPCGLDWKSRGGGLRWGNGRVMAGECGRLHCGLMARFEGEGVRDQPGTAGGHQRGAWLSRGGR
jgi:hypothetical protein